GMLTVNLLFSVNAFLSNTCHLKSKFECIHEGNAQQGNPILLNDIFTELIITEGGSGGVNNEHEVRLIEEASKNKGMQEKTIQYNDIFQPLPGQRKRIRTVLTKGIAGIGKTVSVHKFILGWAEGKANQNIHFVFPLPFRDLNLKGNGKYSVMQLVHQYFPELKDLKSIRSEKVKIVFIFDGLDECRLPLDFKNNEMCCDLAKKISVDVLLTNLIVGNILPSAFLWITSRPAAASQIPSECVDQVTEIRGFNDSEKEQYFRKRFSVPGLADKIVAHIKSSRSLHIMCHIPVFCWISATVLEKMLGRSGCIEVPKTLTQMYTHFLLIQTHLKNKKYHGMIQDEIDLTQSDKEMIIKLGKLAFLQLEKGNMIFYEKDLTECGIDVSKACEYSAICTEIFREEFGLYQEKVFCFVHLSIQEHLAAVYTQLQFVNSNMNILRKNTENQREIVKMSHLHKSAVDRALQSENGHFDLFLRFLLGLSLECNLVLLRGLLSKYSVESLDETVDYIKEKIRKEFSAERTINLFHCLNEINYNAILDEIHSFLKSGRHCETELKPDQCSALAYVLLTSDDVMNEFDMKMCNTSLEGYRRLLPVVRTSRRAILAGVNLTDESCETLALVLQSVNSHLTELDLSFNSLGDLGVKLLCAGLSSPHCKLEELNLSHNELEHIGVKLLCDCLMGLKLEKLDLSYNNLGDSGVKLLSAGLKNPDCKLKSIRLSGCCVTEEGCIALHFALSSNHSQLRELDLSYNHPGKSGVRQLYAILEDPQQRLKDACEITLDPNTAHRTLSLTGSKKVTMTKGEQPYPDHPDRFEYYAEALCREILHGARFYWEVEWTGNVVYIGVTYKGINRKGRGRDCKLGMNNKSWILFCSNDYGYYVSYNNKETVVPTPPNPSKRMGIYLDWQAGRLSYFIISPERVYHIYTFHTTFTEPLYPGIRVEIMYLFTRQIPEFVSVL
uniref:B30.2/SPRY domain-containing protein n=1 Tax=Electrophorus electricus TaxID=8005 RepID=A0A4W4EJ19_ELEEL